MLIKKALFDEHSHSLVIPQFSVLRIGSGGVSQNNCVITK